MSTAPSTPPQELARRWRFWRWRWSIRTLLVIVAIFAFLLSWFGYAYRRSEWKMQIIRSVLVQGGRPMQIEGDVFSVPQPDGWAVLRGDESSLRVIQVHAPVTNGGLDESTVQALARFPELEILTLSGQRIGDAAIEKLGGLDSLEVLALDGTDIAGSCLATIADMDRLEILNLSLTAVGDESLAALGRLKNLKDIRLMDTGVSPAGAETLRGMFPQAQVIYTHCPNDDQRAALQSLIRAGAEYGFDPEYGRTIKIESDQWKGNDKTLAWIADAGEFDALAASGIRPAGGWAILVARPEMLSAIDLYDCGLSPNDIAWIGQAANVRHLAIGKDKLDDLAVQEIGGLHKLQSLNLYESNATVTNWHPLSGLRDLRHLVLDDAPIQDVDLAFLESMPHLEQLILRRTSLTNASVARINRLKKLEILDLDGTNVTDDCVQELKVMTSLKLLSVVGSRISTRGVEDLKTALPDCIVQ